MCKVQLNWRWSKKRALCSAPLSTGRVRGKGVPQRSIPLIWLPLPGSLRHLNTLSPSAWLLLLGTHFLLGFRPIYSLVELRAYGLEDRRRLASTPKLQHHKLQPNSKKTVVEGMKKHTQ